MRYIALMVLAVALTACGSTTHSTSHPTVASVAPSSATPSSAAPSRLDPQTEGIVCADLNALAFAGNSSDPIGTVADANRVTRDQVIQAVNDKCPTLKSIEP